MCEALEAARDFLFNISLMISKILKLTIFFLLFYIIKIFSLI